MSDLSLRLALKHAYDELVRASREVGYANPVLSWDGNVWGPIEASAHNFLESMRCGQLETAEKDAESLLTTLLSGFAAHPSEGGGE